MIGRMTGAAARLMACGALALALAVPPVQARTGADSPRPALDHAVAEAKAMRAKGQRVWCVPFARTASGVDITGNARTWWAAAAGRYARGHQPQVGAVMAFAGSRQMPLGHVAVVAKVVNDRTVLIDHANWSRNRVSLGMVAVDVSAKGDWTAVRVEGSPGVLGRVNPVNGFIYPEAEGERVASR